MKILTFNVNGIRSFVKYISVSNGKFRTFGEFLEWTGADICCFQETKLTLDDIQGDKLEPYIACPNGWDSLFVSCRRGNSSVMRSAAYSGTATFWRHVPQDAIQKYLPEYYQLGLSSQFSTGNLLANYKEATAHDFYLEALSKVSPEVTTYNLDATLKKLDSEGRCIITDHKDFLLLNIYFPLGTGNDERGVYKAQYQALVAQLCQLFIETYHRHVILVGDLNATYDPRDHCDYLDVPTIEGPNGENIFLEDNAIGRKWLYDLLTGPDSLFIDTLRHGTKGKSDITGAFTCWNTLTNARATNYGSRIDYILLDKYSHYEILRDESDIHCDVLQNVFGSDHCPVICAFGNTFTNETHRSNEQSSPQSFIPSMRSFHKNSTKLQMFFEKRKNQHDPLVEISLLGSADIPKSDDGTSNINSNNNGNNNTEISDEKLAKKPKKNLTLDSFFQKPSEKKFTVNLDDEKLEISNPVEKIESLTPDFLETKQAWKDVFSSAPKAPLCSAHGEPCKLYRVNKKGANQGRAFYLCSRGVGPSSDPSSRCNYFKWKKG